MVSATPMTPGQARIGGGHEAGAALILDQDEVDPPAANRIQDFHIFATGQPVDANDARAWRVDRQSIPPLSSSLGIPMAFRRNVIMQLARFCQRRRGLGTMQRYRQQNQLR